MKKFDSAAKVRFDYIDALRGYAILGVIVAHAASITQTQGMLRTVADTGGMGVQLFFVISAFTIFHMLTKHEKKEKDPIRNFFIRRLFRIVPVYWYGILFYTIIFGLGSRGWLAGPELWHFPFHLTLTNVLHPLTQSSVVPGGWSISSEVLFYMSVPFWFRRIRDLSQACVFTMFCIFFLPVLTKLLSKALNPSFISIDPTLVRLYWDRFPLMILGSFSFGICLYFLSRKERVLDLIRPKAINIFATFAVCLLFAFLINVNPWLPVKVHVYCFLFMTLALLLSVRSWKVFVNPATIFLGRISYSAYLFHFVVLKTLTHVASHYAPTLVNNPFVYFISVLFAGIALTVPLAWCGYRFIELPAIEFSKAIISNLESKDKPTNEQVSSVTT